MRQAGKDEETMKKFLLDALALLAILAMLTSGHAAQAVPDNAVPYVADAPCIVVCAYNPETDTLYTAIVLEWQFRELAAQNLVFSAYECQPDGLAPISWTIAPDGEMYTSYIPFRF
jgi:hypothetical protein